MRITTISRAIALTAMLSAFALPAFAQSTKVLTFEGLKDQEPVSQFYNNGTGGNGSGPGNNYGVSFSSNALALIDSDAGGSGNFGGEASPDTILYFTTGSAATLNVPGGFTTGFSFYYASSTTGTITVYDGLDATGNVLATITVPATPMNGGDPTGTFGPFVQAGGGFSGIAKSVGFGGTANQIGFDNITLGSSIPGQGTTTTCASSGYTGTKLLWCQNICEKGYTGLTLNAWIYRWTNKYRDLPYCMQETTPPPQPQG